MSVALRLRVKGRATIEAFLRERSIERAVAQYLQVLAEGASPLVQ